MTSLSKKFVCFGEVLMDEFPTGKTVGGAPMNVAVWLAKLNQTVSMISGVGNDADGKKLLNYLHENNVGTNLIYEADDYSTGVVEVKIDSEGSATYNIPHPVAWDKIPYSTEMEKAVNNADAFFYSTLPARDEMNFNTITELLPHAKYRILDVNLRPPHYNQTVLKSFCKAADFIKFNDDELFEIAGIFESPYKSIEDNLNYLSSITETETICVTKGKYGAVVFHKGNLTYFSGYLTKVVDTVGAGDSFLASFISKFLTGTDTLSSLKFACAVGAFVASNRGANPSISNRQLDDFITNL